MPSNFEATRAVGTFGNTLVLRFETDDCVDIDFQCPDCRDVICISGNQGKCDCRSWKLMMTAHGKPLRKKSSERKS